MATSPRLARLETQSPMAARLAELASLAVRVDAGLLRRLRLRLLPDADADAESDLWFSAIVESRSSSGFQISPDVLEELRTRLSTNVARLKDANAVIEEAHIGASSAIKLEEQLNFIALTAAPGWEQAIDAALRPALAALAQGGPAAKDIARWAMRAGVRLHDIVRQTPAGRTLFLAAPLMLGMRPTVPVPTTSSLAFGDLARLVAPSTQTQTAQVGIAFVFVGLQFREPSPDTLIIDLPATNPRLVGLEWSANGQTVRRTAEAAPGVIVPIVGNPPSVILTTLTGDQYRLTTETSRGDTTSPGPASLPPIAWLEACTRVKRVNETNPGGGVAFFVTPQIALSCRQATADEPFLLHSNAGQLRVLEDLGGLVTLYRSQAPLGTPTQASLPLATSSTPALQRAAVPHVEALEPRWLPIYLEQSTSWPRRAILSDLSHNLAQLPPSTFMGAPVVAGGVVIGMVLSASHHVRTDDPTIVFELATADELNDALRRAQDRVAQTTDNQVETSTQLLFTVAGVEDGTLSYQIGGTGSHIAWTTASRERQIADELLKEWQPLSTSPPVQEFSARLLPSTLLETFAGARDLTLALDAITARYPWELLEAPGAPEPLGARFGMIRSLRIATGRGRALATGRRALVIGDTAPRTASLPECVVEARSVSKAFESAGWSVKLLVKPSPKEVVQTLLSEDWSLLHIAGHGVQNYARPNAPPVNGILLDDEVFLSAPEFAAMRTLPQFIFLNASNIGRLSPVAPVIALSAEYREQSLVLSLLDMGARVVIAPGWEPMDDDARAFAEGLYEGLLRGLQLTEAVRESRVNVRATHPTMTSWACYHCYGEPSFELSSIGAVSRAEGPVDRPRQQANPPPRTRPAEPLKPETPPRRTKAVRVKARKKQAPPRVVSRPSSPPRSRKGGRSIRKKGGKKK